MIYEHDIAHLRRESDRVTKTPSGLQEFHRSELLVES